MRTYDANNASFIANGVYITGFDEGSMMKAEKDEDSFSTKVSAIGEVIISEMNNKLGTVTVTLSQTSPSLQTLMQLANSKKPFPVWVIYNDGSFKERAGGTQARIVKKPGKEYDAEAGGREFQFKVFDYVEE
ncbi:phage structural protein [Priestia aryabhattai]|uniref:phage structural protein n=1 Tax=Priestia megaterium TaxID=1404 RepID=UPI0039B9A780